MTARQRADQANQDPTPAALWSAVRPTWDCHLRETALASFIQRAFNLKAAGRLPAGFGKACLTDPALPDEFRRSLRFELTQMNGRGGMA